MVQKEITFNDGTRIFYEEKNGRVYRYIEYNLSPFEKEQIKKNPTLEAFFKKSVKKRNCGKFDYLQELGDIARKLNDNQRQQLYNELKELHDKVGKEYDPNIKNANFLRTFGKYWRGNEKQCAAFFVTIYLAMLDLEEDKSKYPRSLGKTMVLKSCEAVILKNVDYRDAAVMFERKRETISNDYYDGSNDDDGSRFEKYNGYNGYDDGTIDEAFDGFREATWNVD
jgi:hypothetical protein